MFGELDSLDWDWYLVGGYVRDSLLGVPAKDRDIASSLLPQEVLYSLPPGWKGELTNKAHLVVTLLSPQGERIEHTTFRVERDCDGRHAHCSPCLSIEEDLGQRDFTINAMALNKEGILIDPYGGQRDLSLGILRFVGSPEERLREHGGRLFRLARFAVRYGFSIHEDSLRAAISFAPSVFSYAPQEGVYEEWKKGGDAVLSLLGEWGVPHLSNDPFRGLSGGGWWNQYLSSGMGDVSSFGAFFKLPRKDMDILRDLEKAAGVMSMGDLMVTPFKVLSPLEAHQRLSLPFPFISLPIPSQGDIYREGYKGKGVKEEWERRVRLIFS